METRGSLPEIPLEAFMAPNMAQTILTTLVKEQLVTTKKTTIGSTTRASSFQAVPGEAREIEATLMLFLIRIERNSHD